MTELPWPPAAAGLPWPPAAAGLPLPPATAELPWPPAAAGLTGQVAAALEKSLLPSIIARGAAVRVAGVQDGVATLELTGSPGAVVPLAARIEAQIRAAVPGITGVRIVTPGDPAPPEAAATLAEQARRIIDGEINPAIAAHRGRAVLAGAEDGWVRIRLAQPTFRVVPAAATEDVLRQAAAEVGGPCVVKATSLSASQGVLRADDPAAAVAAARRVREVLATAGRPDPSRSWWRSTCRDRSSASTACSPRER